MKVRIEIHLDDKKEVKYLDKMATDVPRLYEGMETELQNFKLITDA